MSFSFKNIEHAFASAAQDIVKEAKAVEKVIASVAATAIKYEPTIELITSFVDPAAVPLERAAFSALGFIAKTANDVDLAAAQQFFGQSLDAQMWADFKAVWALVSTRKGFLAGPPVMALPAPAVQSQPKE